MNITSILAPEGLHPTPPRKIMTTMGKVDTSDLVMIIREVINISSRSSKLERTSYNPTYCIEIMEGNPDN